MSGFGGVGGPAGLGGNAAGVQQIMALRQQLVERSSLLKELRDPANAGAATPANGSGFTDALQNALKSVNESQVKAETLSDGYEKGEVVDVAKVMLARQEAGVAFEATLQVRNRLISAYQDIMRMGV